MVLYKSQYLAHLTLFQKDLGHPYIDGAYWSLYWEVYFYLLVFVVLFLKMGRWLEPIFLTWPILIFICWLFGQTKLPGLYGFYSYFAAGAVFAIMRNKVTWPAIVSLTCSFVVCFHHATLSKNLGTQSPYVVGALIVGMFLFFFIQNTDKVASLKLPGSKLAGALTYPLYLLHQNIGYIILDRFATEQTKYVWIVGLTLAMLLAAYLVHLLVERLPATWWKAFFGTLVATPINRLSQWLDRWVIALIAWGKGMLVGNKPAA